MSFLETTEENPDHNQYWYSAKTIETIVREISDCGAIRIAFLSTPSLYFSLSNENQKSNSYLFEYDDAWANDPRFVKFDFNDAECIPENLRNTFDMVVIDPPFITRDVWDKYAAHAHKLLHKSTATVPHISPFPDSPLKDTFHGLCLVTSIAENADMLHELLGVKRVAFQPSIPNLIYQYDMYTNFPVKHTDTVNSEISW